MALINDNEIYIYPVTMSFRGKEFCRFAMGEQMKILCTLLPGKSGTKKIVDIYGEELICVRYRNDLKNKQRLTTRELVIDRQKWNIAPCRTPPNKLMNLRIDYGERELV